VTSPTARTLTRLCDLGYHAVVVERWIPQANVRRDAFGFGDILACHPGEHVVLLVQATTVAHVAHRLAKARALPELAAWLRAGGQFQVWGWEQRGGRWQPRIVAVEAQDLTAVVLQAPRRRRPKGRPVEPLDLFAGLDREDTACRP
jgi:hypothetical protein